MPSLFGTEIKLALPDYMITILVPSDLVLYLVGIFDHGKVWNSCFTNGFLTIL